MAKEANENTEVVIDKFESLLNNVKGDLNKAKLESIKGKLKEKLKEREEHEKAIRLIDADLAKISDDYKNGIL